MHPWLGLDFFTEETRAYFYGREEEVAELARRVHRKPLTVLFGQSGLGKTSILRAGIVPRLRPEGFCPVYVRIDYARDAPSPSEQIKQAILRATQASGEWTQTGVASAGETLWEFLHHRDDILRDASGRTLIPLLIFDQFEEIFTLAQTDDFGRQRAAQFIEDLADLVENRAPRSVEARIEKEESSSDRFDFARCDYRILIALREDYLAHLEAFKAAMPSITQNRMRLARMTGTQALSAVTQPGGKLVSEEVAEAIVRFVAGDAEIANAEVEPSLLSLICRELNNARIAQGRSEISTDLLAGSHASILSEFYSRALADQPPGVHRFIEDELLTDSGFRENVAEERVLKEFAAAGATPDALPTLVNRRLLRIEERLDVRRVELTHDVLCSVVGAARAARHEREQREQAERELAAQQAREQATRAALARARMIAGVCAVLALIAVAGAVFGYLSMQRARQAEARADQVRNLSETARAQAEKLVVYLLDDFYRELEPVGRLDVIAQLAQRTIGYYDALPAALRTPDSERNRALASVRYAAVLRSMGRGKDGEAAVDQAVDSLEQLYKQGDRSEPTLVGLALGLSIRGRLHEDARDTAAALRDGGRAVDILAPFAEAQGASVGLRRAYNVVLTYDGYLILRDNRAEEAIPVLEKARAAAHGIANLSMSDPAAVAAYAEASSWEVEALWAAGRVSEANRIGEEALKVSRELLERRPGHAQALRTAGNLASNLGQIAGEAGHLARGVALESDSEKDWGTLLRIDPTNVVVRNNLGASVLAHGAMLQSLGRPGEAFDLYAQLYNDIEPHVGSSGMLASNIRFPAFSAYFLAADLGRVAAMEDWRARLRHAAERFGSMVPVGSFDREVNDAYAALATLQVAQARGDNAAVLRGTPALQAQAAAMHTGGEGDQYLQHQLQRDIADTDSESAYATGNYSRAIADGEISTSNMLAMKPRKISDLRTLDDERGRLALALARAGRNAEALQLLGPVLEHQKAWRVTLHEDQQLKLEAARALLASAAAHPGGGRAELEEARQLVGSTPVEMRGLASVAIWKSRIDEELKRHH
jgi:tetratricopeptide (TPR) repeat protein